MRARVVTLLLCLLLSTHSPSRCEEAPRPAAGGLDHIPVAVRDLDRAAATYRALGFALKPGRDHANGIRNVHVKFPDGAGIELLTAPRAADPLSAHYVSCLRAGEGPVSFTLHARDTERLHTVLRDGGYRFRHEGEITAPLAPELDFLFLVRDNRSPTDRPEHFAHGNGATALRAVWLATGNNDALARLLVRLGGRMQRREVLAPEPVEATVVTFDAGEVLILPQERQVVAGRPVIGATFSVRDLPTVERVLADGRIERWAGADTAERIVVEPTQAHGLWLEFRADN